ncbi:MAG: BREX-1 system adenine-specific DNA-methyltransferase PglX [Archaeoglobaceae archaeon]|nr:BREX-1 system adenine-specific DNA-methyltransferase PglX [Archaeoglobaceae archaeon]MDW8118577.1 Eco57I restriction-modification methylase domain-containing protein [Archaeoglobaceae archaeon]
MEQLRDVEKVIPKEMEAVKAWRLYIDDYIEFALIEVKRSLTRGICIRCARKWKEKRLIRPLMIFTDGEESYVVIILGKSTGGEARVLYLHETLYRTDAEAIISMAFPGDQERLKECYDKYFLPYEKVREEFFNDYRDLYQEIVKQTEKILKEETSGYAQRFLGRLMFLYFLQRKGWLKGDKRFIDKVKDYYELNKLFYEALNKKNGEEGIPFLNGSLFDREKYLTPELEKKLYPIMNEIFLKARETFNKYNFTVDETSPLEVEVSIDPLLLGTVLENMLPEHERGAKGTFYTPINEISFICKRAIANWLGLKDRVEETGSGYVFIDALDEYVNKLKKEKDESKVRDFRKKLLNLKVLDPAVGSGGFLVVMMQTILQLIQEVEEACGWKTDVELYKRTIIPNLYGFDIEPEAVEIARLRIWLSLIVAQKKPEPLPNLDLNIVTIGDSLQTPKGVQELIHRWVEDSEYRIFAEEIENLKAKYLNEHDPEMKNALRKKIEEKQIEFRRKTGMEFRAAPPIEFYMPTLADVIVMNPPYVRQESIQKERKEEYSALYGLDKKSDLYAYFMVRILRLLTKNGVAVAITSDKWLEVGYGEELQKKLKPHLIAVYGQKTRSFGADINTVISALKRERLAEDSPIEFIYLEKYGEEKVINYKKIPRKELQPGKWYYLRAPRIFEELIKPKLTEKLGDFAEIKRGFTTGANEFFYMKDITHLYESDYLVNPKKFEEWGVKAKNRRELEEQSLIYIENEGGERFVINRKDVLPVFRSPRDVESWVIESPTTLVLYTDNPGLFTKKYIQWGESKEIEIKKGVNKGKKVVGYHKLETLRNRSPWYSLTGTLKPTNLILIKFNQERHFELLSLSPILADHTCDLLYLRKDGNLRNYTNLWLYLNSTVFYLTKEMYGMRMGGGGGVLQMLTNFFENIPVPDLSTLKIDFDAEKLMKRKPLPYYEEIKQPDRKELDKAVLKAMGFPEKELDKLVEELHKAFVEVVEDRLIKADRPLPTETVEEEEAEKKKRKRRARA